MSTQGPSLWRILSETSRIISANTRHFLALSVLFLFPVSFATIITSFLFQPTSLHSRYHRFLSNVSQPDSKLPPAGNSQLLIQISCFLFGLIFNLFAVPSITYSAFHGFYGRQVKFISSLKSILVSFFPLLVTNLVTMIIVGLITFVMVLLMLLPYTARALLGFNMDYGSIFFMVYVILIAVLLVGLMTYLGIEWCLATAVVVMESMWGFAPLKRSSYLVKGVRGVVFSMTLLFGTLGGLLSIWCSNLRANYAGNVSEGRIGWIAVQMIAYAGFSTVFSLYGLVAETVLFIYCREFHGELEVQIDGKLGGDGGYVRLPFDAV